MPAAEENGGCGSSREKIRPRILSVPGLTAKTTSRQEPGTFLIASGLRCFKLNEGFSVFGCLSVSAVKSSETNQFWRLIHGTGRNHNELDLPDRIFAARS